MRKKERQQFDGDPSEWGASVDLIENADGTVTAVPAEDDSDEESNGG